MPDLLTYAWGNAVENVWYLIVFGYGAIVGSFLNVVIYRLPLGLSVTKPASYCPNCNTYLGFFDNIPLVGFLGLGGRCRYCRIPISWRYFTVELLTACLWVALFHRIAQRPLFTWMDFVAQALFASVLIAAIFIDLDHFIVPDQLNVIGFVLGLARDIGCLVLAWNASADIRRAAFDQFSYFDWLPRALPGALIYGGTLFLFSFVSFIYYARMEGESVVSVARRFFIWDDESAQTAELAAEAEANAQTQKRADALALTNPAQVTDAVATNNASISGEEDEAMEDEPEPVRLRFSPGFICLVAALLLAPVVGVWAVAFFAIPLVAFALLTRKKGESFGEATARFFRSDDLGEYHRDDQDNTPPDASNGGSGDVQTAPVYEPVAPAASAPNPAPVTFALASASGAPLISQAAAFPTHPPISPMSDNGPISAAEAREEADRFALEAETGQHGGMGLGDAKLALAVGAMLGPGMALLSLFFATFVGAITGTVLARMHGRSLRLGLPFVPFMAVGAILVMLYGEPLVTWYLTLAPFTGATPTPPG